MNRDGSLSSVTSSILDYEFENGRRYHAYKAGRESPFFTTFSDHGEEVLIVTSDYPLPNDEVCITSKTSSPNIPPSNCESPSQIELDRLDLQHHVIKLLLNGEIHLAPLDNPRRILDIGTGTGLWAIEMADRYPNATVTGTDLSPVQPTWYVNLLTKTQRESSPNQKQLS